MSWGNTVSFNSLSNYNFSDLNRENTNIQYLKDQLDSLGYIIPLPKTIKTNYSRLDFPTVSAINNVRENIKTLVDGFCPVQAPLIIVNTSRKQIFNDIEANIIESNLQALYDAIGLVPQSYKYAGTFSAGETIVL